MQAATAVGALGLARSRARKWLRVFQQLVRVLDRLEREAQSPLASALVFLVQRALGGLDATDPAAPVAALEPEGVGDGDAAGDELMAAVDLARHARDRRDLRDDPASDELEVLLVFAGALTEAPDGGAFGDLSIGVEALVHEYRSLKHLSADDVLRVSLFPAAFRRRWSALLKSAAAKDDPLRRLALELSVMKVIHALYAMAIGRRRAANFGPSDPDGDPWLACTLGESTLKSIQR